MSKKAKIDFLIAGVCAVLFILLIVLLKTVDVQGIGPEGTSIGFAGINGAFHNATGYKDGLYTLSKLLGIAAIFLIYSICKTIKRRMEERKSLQTLENDLRNLEKSDKRK
jgi:undecaprenyl-diphosphatase